MAFGIRRHASLRSDLSAMEYGLLTTDIKGKVTGLNEAAEKLLGWNYQAAKGKPVSQIMHLVNHDTRAMVDNPVTAILKGGKTARLANNTILIARNSMERPFESSAAPLRSFGRLTGTVSVLRDVTEYYTVCQKLLESEERLKVVTDEVCIGLVMLNRDRRYVYANNFYKQMVGVPEDTKLVGRQVGEVLPIIYDQIKPNLDRAFAGERLSYGVQGINKGLGRTYSVTYEPQKHHSLVMHVVIVVLDVTHIKRTAQASA